MRRSRLLAALLFAASPAAGGTLLPAIHPCPVDSPWLAHHAAPASHVGHHAGEHGTPASGHQRDVCHCIGTCLAGFAAAPLPQGVVQVVTLVVPVRAVWPDHDSSLRLGPLAALLPPSTAPPASLG